ncbi:GNAT family N-acetyltransferase [Sandaracinus amylolyticus]|uniref:Histone acetyltransferase HPA2 n=1 Tax=Sandaracinus amylolyticus TaxID=927083 RepID=A0A0F6YGU8_9BACT|nr:GNAT family N-acetyltransferase [Sandaracinus amylolyticus]AKF05095.1 Histone acetyltransferase HPA2 [Sandaracinus amylolyticus]
MSTTTELRVTTWSLEMRSAPRTPPRIAPEGLELRTIARPPLHFYRYLYETVGAPWLWVDRRRMDDAALATIVHDARVEIAVAYERGVPAGYYELDRRVPREVELAYFGLVPEAIGRGIGPWLLDAAIRRAWDAPEVERVWVHTCSLDHPSARATYERAGFTVYDVKETLQADPRPLPITPR